MADKQELDLMGGNDDIPYDPADYQAPGLEQQPYYSPWPYFIFMLGAIGYVVLLIQEAAPAEEQPPFFNELLTSLLAPASGLLMGGALGALKDKPAIFRNAIMGGIFCGASVFFAHAMTENDETFTAVCAVISLLMMGMIAHDLNRSMTTKPHKFSYQDAANRFSINGAGYAYQPAL